VKQRRLVEGLVVVVVLAVLATLVSGPQQVAQLLGHANPLVYSLAFLAAFAWLLAWSETLYVLLGSQHGGLHWLRFRLVFLGGMGLRDLVPGGVVIGPAVIAYVVATSTPVESEESLAMSFVAEVCYWLGSVVVAVVGLVGMVVLGQATPPRNLLAVLGVLTLLGGLLLAVGVRRPTLVEWPAHRVAWLARATVGRFSERLREALTEDAIDERLERFFDALARLADDPRLLVPALGWSVVGWAAKALALYLTLAALGLAVSPFVPLFVVTVGGVAEGLSLFPGGLGSVESSQALLLVVLTSLTLGPAGVAVFLYRLTSYWFRLPLGAASLLYLGVREPVMAEGSVVEQLEG